MEKVPGQLECQLKITDDNLLTNQVYYQNAKSVAAHRTADAKAALCKVYSVSCCSADTVIFNPFDERGVNAALQN